MGLFLKNGIFYPSVLVKFLSVGPEAGMRVLPQVFREDHSLPLINGHQRHEQSQVGKA